MVYQLIKRKKSVSARTDRDFVTWMRKQDFVNFADNDSFMQAYAHRKATFENLILRTDSEEHFVEDLKHHGLLEVTKTQRRRFILF